MVCWDDMFRDLTGTLRRPGPVARASGAGTLVGPDYLLY